MTKPVTIPNAFASQSGNVPSSELDADFNALAAAANDTATYGNYYVDTGAVNALVVTTTPPVTFSYALGAWLDVLIANTNTSTTVAINVNAISGVAVLDNAGNAPAIGSLLGGSVYRLVFDGTAMRVSSSSIATTGSFTGTLTGCSTAPTGTVYYTKIYNQVTLSIPAITATSNATTKTITGLLASLTPAAQTYYSPLILASNNGAAIYTALCALGPSGVLTYWYSAIGPGGWTNSGVCQVGQHTFTYLTV